MYVSIYVYIYMYVSCIRHRHIHTYIFSYDTTTDLQNTLNPFNAYRINRFNIVFRCLVTTITLQSLHGMPPRGVRLMSPYDVQTCRPTIARENVEYTNTS